MKKTFELTITAKEALELLATPGAPKSIIKRLVKGIQEGNVQPKGALAAAKAAATAPKKTESKSGVSSKATAAKSGSVSASAN